MKGRLGRFLASLLAVSMVLQLVPTVAFGADEMVLDVPVMEEEMEIAELLEWEELDAELMGEEVAELSATYSGTCGDNLTWVYDSSTYTLTISGTGNMTEYTSSSSVPWYSYSKSIQTVVIAAGVTSIGSYAFSRCSSLESIAIPDGVTSIGDVAFSECSSLKSIVIPEGVTSIGDSAFDSCSSLESMAIPDGVTSIGVYEFYECSSLKSIVIPAEVTSIGEFAFSGCNSLESIAIPVGVTSIKSFTFYECSSLESITILDGITSIGNNAFSRCSSLESIAIPDGVTSIGDVAFSECSSLKSIVIPEGVTSIGYSVFQGCSSLEGIIIPEGVTSIGEWAFSGCSSLESIAIPDGVTSIEYAAFRECSNLESIIIPAGVTSIGDYAFLDCNSLESITIPDGVTSIGERAFSGCSSLESMAIPDGVTSIGSSVFNGCSSLKSITIPAGVTSVGNYAFYSCSSLTDVYYTGTESGWNAISIGSNNTYLTNATIHYNLDLSSVINNSNFSIPDDIFSFGNGSSSFGDTYYIARTDFDGLMNKLSFSDQWSVRSVVGRAWDYGWGSAYSAYNSRAYNGVCFGMTTAMALIKNKDIYPNMLDPGTTKIYDVEKPIDNDNARSMLTYYWMLQYINEFDEEDKGKTDQQMAKELVDALKYGDETVIVNFKTLDLGDGSGEHSILAYAIDEESDSDYYIIYITDPNTLIGEAMTVTDPDGIYIYAPYMMIDKETYEVLSYQVGPTSLQQFKSFVSVISDLSKYEGYLSPIGIVIGVVSREYTVITTYNAPITISTSEGSYSYDGEEGTGDLEVYGPYSTIGGDEDSAVYRYYLLPTDEVTVTYDDSETKTTSFIHADGEYFYEVNSDAKTLKFTSTGNVEVSEATTSEATTVATAKNETTLPWSITAVSANVDNITLQATEDSVEISSSADLENLTAIGNDGWNSYSVATDESLTSATVAANSIQSSICLLSEDTILTTESLSYSVYFDTQGGSEIDPVDNILHGETIVEPETPIYAGYIFDGWYADDSFETAWDFAVDTITEKTTLYAKWIEITGIDIANMIILDGKAYFDVEVVGTADLSQIKILLALYTADGKILSVDITEGIEEGENTISIDPTSSYATAKLFTMDADNKPILSVITTTE